MKFFIKLKKLERSHMRELALLCGAAAVLLVVAGFIAAGGTAAIGQSVATNGISPTSLTATIFPCSWTGSCSVSTAYYFSLTASTNSSSPGQQVQLVYISGVSQSNGASIGYCDTPGSVGYNDVISSIGTPLCTLTGFGQVYTNDATRGGSVYVYPTQNTTYTFCSAVSGGCTSTTINVTPAIPSTFVSFTANPSTVAPGGTTNLHWLYNPGNNFYGCEITGGKWGTSGFYWLPSNDNGVNNNVGVLNASTTYQINCYDSQNGWGAWHPLTVTVSATPAQPTAPAGSCTDIPAAVTVPNGCVTPSPAPGICTPTGGSYSAGTNTCSCPAGTHLSGSACVANAPAALCSNGLNNSYAPSCICPAGQYQPLGASSCVALPICANGLNSSYSPSCTCPAGQVQVKGGSTCVQPGVINSLTANPSRVLKGNTTTVTWSTSGMSVCALSGFNANGTSALSSALNSSLQQTVTAKTVYTLSCTDASGASYASSVTLNLIPVTVEQ